MARTTAVQVAKIIEVDPAIGLDDFISFANELVTEICQPLGYTDVRLEQIERYLAAHFYAIFDKEARKSAESVGGALTAQFAGKVDLGLNLTYWGQQAMILDTQAGLAKLNKRIVSGVGEVGIDAGWLGNSYIFPDPEREAYEEPT